MSKALEQAIPPNEPSEQKKKELLNVAEQIEKGVKWDRIPAREALTLLRDLNSKYLEQAPEDELEECINLMEQIEDGVEQSRIPADEAVSLFRELNDKYPVEDKKRMRETL